MAAARRITAKTRIFQLKVQLAGIRQPVWRRVLVPGEVDLAELHEVIQTAFGWTNSHLHQFEIGRTRYGTPTPIGEWTTSPTNRGRNCSVLPQRATG